MKNQWIDLDLDYLNTFDDPMDTIRRLLFGLGPSTPCVVVVEHHHVMPHVAETIAKNILSTPMHVFHIDEHHDMYDINDWMNNRFVDCGNYLFPLLSQHYSDKFDWVHNDNPANEQWHQAVSWMNDMNIQHKRTEQWEWNPRRVGLVTIALSPDFTCDFLMEQIFKLLKIIDHKMHPRNTVRRRPKSDDISNPDDWRNIRRRKKRNDHR